MNNLIPFSFLTSTISRKNRFFLDYKDLGDGNLHSLLAQEILHLGLSKTYVVITRYKGSRASFAAVTDLFVLTDRFGIVLVTGVATEIINYLAEYQNILDSIFENE